MPVVILDLQRQHCATAQRPTSQLPEQEAVRTTHHSEPLLSTLTVVVHIMNRLKQLGDCLHSTTYHYI